MINDPPQLRVGNADVSCLRSEPVSRGPKAMPSALTNLEAAIGPRLGCRGLPLPHARALDARSPGNNQTVMLKEVQVTPLNVP